VNGITAVIFGKLFDRWGVYALAGGILVSLLALPLGFLADTPERSRRSAAGRLGSGTGRIAAWRNRTGSVDEQTRRRVRAFNGVYGVAWFAGSAVMGLLYDHSLVALVAFGVAAQVGAAGCSCG